MHEIQTQSQGGIPLSQAIPSVQSRAISQLVAFPSSLAALRHGIKWNASCWVANQRLDEFEQLQIAEHAFRGHQRTPHIEWCQFASDIDGRVSMLIVFPELQASFRSPEIMERWTDTVVLPAFRQLGIPEGVLTSSFKIIQMTAEAEREQTLNDYAPDTPLVEVLSKKGGVSAQDMQDLWAAIQENANKTSFFTSFRNLFLVATCRQPPAVFPLQSVDESSRAVIIAWDNAIDMNFVPLSAIRANTTTSTNAPLLGTDGPGLNNGHDVPTTYQVTPESIWESSRKRKVHEEIQTEKRSRLEDGETQPLSAARVLATPTSKLNKPADEDAEMVM